MNDAAGCFDLEVPIHSTIHSYNTRKRMQNVQLDS
jgi:hypothetical protein